MINHNESEMGMISTDDELIRRTPNGRFILYKSNFDFLEKPKSTFEDSHELR